MTFTSQAITLDWGWTIGGTPEIANTGIHISQTGAPWSGAVVALGEMDGGTTMSDLYDAMSTFMSTASCGWADYSDLRSVKAAAVGTDGLYLTEPVIFDSPSPDSGTTSNVLPQSSIVFSLRSGLTIGRANYGRMYLPHTRPTLTAGGPFVAGATCDAIAAAGVTFITALSTIINAATTDALVPCLMSSVGSGTTKAIANVQVGNVIDTQRRRRNKLVETYSVDS